MEIVRLVPERITGLREFFQMVREGAEGWDGSEPLRPAAT
jgi:hypothetical protein